MAISRILSGRFLGRDDHSSLPNFSESPIPRSRDRDATIPEVKRAGCPPSVLSCTAWGFSCLANCFVSGELLPRLFTLTCSRREAVSFPYSRSCQRTGGVFSVTLSVTEVFQPRRPRILRGMLPYGVRTFLQRIPPTRDSPAIICHRRVNYHKNRNLEARKP
jgi:hypothetical protein